LRKNLLHPTSAPWSGTLRRVQAVKDIEMVDPVAIGDEVMYIEAGDGTGVIHEVMERRNKLVRHAAGAKRLEQVIVANVDQVVPIMAAAQPNPQWQFLDRYLIAAEAADIRAIICINKMDLASNKTLKAIEIYQEIGYEVLQTSVETGQGIDEFRATMAGRTSVLVGMSGVGKTSLLNTIEDDLGLRVREISEANNKGRHTTTHLEMFPLAIGGHIIDTPGIKYLSLWEVDQEDLATLFVEMEPYVGECRFRLKCTHTHEPGCAIKEAVEAGYVSEMRYRNFLIIREEMQHSN
jgi:ribosome biogenesis GTPase